MFGTIDGVELPDEPVCPIPTMDAIEHAETNDELDALEWTLDGWRTYFEKVLECLPSIEMFDQAREECKTAMKLCEEKRGWCGIHREFLEMRAEARAENGN
ncbi:hypothetical protein K461DRAFT_272130 [Myriangium duriaei CBS 260.36]|uniref:Uncharacterized protein n=1 Tax=Myriangium duriaei CBS 260.36 TaxID=1168546 RepID=A0A9P4MHJ5_9PEZI|nr:hypothetical protein K461DRAFT_272130 [Myriangium duriaei CBS 260.36]